jgi:hypothetical protein
LKAFVGSLAEAPNTEPLTSNLEGMEIETVWRPEDKLKALVGGPTEAIYKNLPLTWWDVEMEVVQRSEDKMKAVVGDLAEADEAELPEYHLHFL